MLGTGWGGELGGLEGRAGDSLVARVSRGRKARVAMAMAGGGMAPRFWALRCCSCRLFQVQQVGAGRAGERAVGRGPWLTALLCPLLGQAERQVELQRVRPAAGGAEGEGPGRAGGGGLCGGNGKPSVVAESPVGWQWGAQGGSSPYPDIASRTC